MVFTAAHVQTGKVGQVPVRALLVLVAVDALSNIRPMAMFNIVTYDTFMTDFETFMTYRDESLLPMNCWQQLGSVVSAQDSSEKINCTSGGVQNLSLYCLTEHKTPLLVHPRSSCEVSYDSLLILRQASFKQYFQYYPRHDSDSLLAVVPLLPLRAGHLLLLLHHLQHKL